MSDTDTNHHGITDEQLDLHASALRGEPVPDDGPSPAALDATLEMLRTQRVTAGRRRSFFERTFRMTKPRSIAAAALLAVGVAAIYVLSNQVGPSVAFADVADKLKDARTIQYTSTTALPNGKTVAIRTLAAEPDMMRTEMPDGTVSIRRGDVNLTLNPKTKTASRVTIGGRPGRPQGGGPGGIVEAMRTIGQRGGEPLGEKEIDGVTAVGFRTEGAPGPWTIWADKKTAAPLRVEMTMHVNGGVAPMVIDKFVLDAPLDEKLFSLDPPEGYTLSESQLTLPKMGELAADVAGLLRAYSDASGGAFPASLTDWAGINKMAKQDAQIAMKVGGVSGRLFGLREGYGYAGKTVRRGEKDKMVFWYKPRDGKSYRAVFGDLRVEDVAEDKLPTTKPLKPAEAAPQPRAAE